MKLRRTILALAAAGATVLALSACSSAPASPLGSWGNTDAQQKPSLVFEDDGSYHGNDGCNNVMGQWSTEGDTIDLGDMASTMMYCEGVDTWLSKSQTAKMGSKTALDLYDENGTHIGTLVRQG